MTSATKLLMSIGPPKALVEIENPVMNRRTKGVLLAGGLAVATAVATLVVLAVRFAQFLDRCEIRDPMSAGCSTRVSITTGATQSSRARSFQSGYVDITSWVIHTPVAASASDDLEVELSDTTGLPRPKRWVLTTAKNSPFIKSIHVETPLDLTAVLGFYRAELSKRGWTENDGALVEPGHAVIAFTTSDGPGLLRLIHQDDRTIADLSLRKVAAAKADILPSPGQVRLMLGNDTDEEAAITINEQTFKLAAHTGRDLTDYGGGRKSSDSPEIDLPPGKFKVNLKVASKATQNREFEVAADETWGLLVGPAGVPLPVRLY